MHGNRKLIIYTDGGARGNPGPAGIGIVIESPKQSKLAAGQAQSHKVIKTYKEYIGETTNNQAEYRAVVKALQLAKSLKAQELEVKLDSELVAKQLNMEYKIKNKDLGPWFIKIWNLRQSFEKATFTHVPREQNKLADQLVNQAIDEGTVGN